MPESENVALTPNQPRAALAETSKQVEAHQVLGRILRGSPLGLIRQIPKNLPHFWEKSPRLFSSITRSDTAGGHDSWIVGYSEVNFRFARDSGTIATRSRGITSGLPVIRPQLVARPIGLQLPTHT